MKFSDDEVSDAQEAFAGPAFWLTIPRFCQRIAFLLRTPIVRMGNCFEGASKVATVTETKTAYVNTNPLKIGATFPNFDVKTTKGDFSLHTWLTEDTAKPWTVFFSHPKDYTPVCTTELGACHCLAEKFEKMGAKLIGVSCDSVEDHHGWSKDVLHRESQNRPLGHPPVAAPGVHGSLNFPIIADESRSIVTDLGMLDPEERDGKGVPLPARALVILHGTTVKLTILYPATTGRNFDEVLRVLTSLQLTADAGLATPVDWQYGQRVIVSPAVTTADAKAKFEDFKQEAMPSGKEYLRSVQCPPEGMTNPKDDAPSGPTREKSFLEGLFG